MMNYNKVTVWLANTSTYEVEQLTLVDVTKAKRHLLELTHSEFISPYIKELAL